MHLPKLYTAEISLEGTKITLDKSAFLWYNGGISEASYKLYSYVPIVEVPILEYLLLRYLDCRYYQARGKENKLC